MFVITLFGCLFYILSLASGETTVNVVDTRKKLILNELFPFELIDRYPVTFIDQLVLRDYLQSKETTSRIICSVSYDAGKVLGKHI